MTQTKMCKHTWLEGTLFIEFRLQLGPVQHQSGNGFCRYMWTFVDAVVVGFVLLDFDQL